MARNTDIYPLEYLAGDISEEEARINDLQRQILVLRNQGLLQSRRAGVSIAEVQNQGIKIQFNRYSSVRPQNIIINNTYNITNITNVVKPAPPPAPVTVAPPPQIPQPAPPSPIRLGKAFIGGGNNNGSHNIVDKFVFNGTTASPAGWSLSGRRQRHAGMASWRYGYWAGGQRGGNITSRLNSFEGVNLTTETRLTVSATLSASQVYCSAAYDTRTAYIGGDYSPLGTTITRFNMVDESSSVNGASLSGTRGGCVSLSFAGEGYFVSGFPNRRNIDKINFSSGAVTSIAAQTSVARVRGGGFRKDNRGYVCGGDTTGTGNNSSSVDRFRRPAESITLLNQQIGRTMGLTEGLEGDIYGYLFGGYNRRSKIRHMRFFNEAWYITSANLSRGGSTAVPAGRKR